jgi:methylthioribose-1-phosphate isomerase
MKVDGTWRRAIESSIEVVDGAVIVLDQRALPHAIAWQRLVTLDDACVAIREMTVRGAPLIGATAAWGVALALGDGIDLDTASARLAATRPTAVNLQWALSTMRRALRDLAAPDRLAEARRLATQICDEDVARNEAIGRHGGALLRELAERRGRVNVLTHCNAGWLATVDWGTALAPIYRAHEDGIPVHVWVDETRPRNQGLLTCWELAQHGVPHTLIADNAGGHLMQHGKVDLCLVGTDRTTRNGDVCNKIGTYLKALAAHDTSVPFYVAAPLPSVDFALASGADVPIEERSGDELRVVRGLTADAATSVAIATGSTAVANPAFDVTPARLITAIITERGIVAPSQLASLA